VLVLTCVCASVCAHPPLPQQLPRTHTRKHAYSTHDHSPPLISLISPYPLLTSSTNLVWLVWLLSCTAAQMSMRGHLLLDPSTSAFGSFLNTSPLNKSPSTRPQVSRTRYPPSDVPSASKMKQRISEAFGSSKNIIYSHQDPNSGVPETSIVPLQQNLVPCPAPYLSSSPSKAAARRRRCRIPSSLPPSSPLSSSGVDETEEPAFDPHRHSTSNLEPEDPYGLLRGNKKFSRLRRRHPPQSIIGGPPGALGQLENLSPITPCAHTSTSVSSGRTSGPFTSFRVEPTYHNYRDGGAQQGYCPDPDAGEGVSETLSGLLARLPRARRQPQRQRQDSRATSTSVSTTIEPAKTAVKKERGKQRRKKTAGDEASHLKGEDRAVRNTVYNF
jgi:hypothetical protein